MLARWAMVVPSPDAKLPGGGSSDAGLPGEEWADDLSLPLAVVDSEGRIEAANVAMSRLLGVTLGGSGLRSWREFADPASIEELQAALTKARHVGVAEGECRLLTPKGRLHVRYRISSLPDVLTSFLIVCRPVAGRPRHG